MAFAWMTEIRWDHKWIKKEAKLISVDTFNSEKLMKSVFGLFSPSTLFFSSYSLFRSPHLFLMYPVVTELHVQECGPHMG